jgi:hypothetical protein
MVTVRLIDKRTLKPVKGKKVALGIHNAVTRGQWTDSNGETHFDVNADHGKVFVNGSKEYEDYLSGLIVLSI